MELGLRAKVLKLQVFGTVANSGPDLSELYPLIIVPIVLPYMGGCQNYGPLLGTLSIRCRIIIGIQKGTIILTTIHIILHLHLKSLRRV